jgi:hypothetical protein
MIVLQQFTLHQYAALLSVEEPERVHVTVVAFLGLAVTT